MHSKHVVVFVEGILVRIGDDDLKVMPDGTVEDVGCKVQYL